ncbi:MAG: hypothetical protein GWN48_07115, partial [Actinobacteria bacterium]|nr:hypothetical protein [Actinomycetota bacterium]
MPDDEQKQAPGGWRSRVPFGRWFWVVFLALLAVNWIVTNALLGDEPPIRVPYTDFIVQLDG